MQMCLPTACAMADGVGFVCAVCVLCGVVWCACVRVCICIHQMCSWELGSIFVIVILSITLYWLYTKTSSFN